MRTINTIVDTLHDASESDYSLQALVLIGRANEYIFQIVRDISTYQRQVEIVSRTYSKLRNTPTFKKPSLRDRTELERSKFQRETKLDELLKIALNYILESYEFRGRVYSTPTVVELISRSVDLVVDSDSQSTPKNVVAGPSGITFYDVFTLPNTLIDYCTLSKDYRGSVFKKFLEAKHNFDVHLINPGSEARQRGDIIHLIDRTQELLAHLSVKYNMDPSGSSYS